MTPWPVSSRRLRLTPASPRWGFLLPLAVTLNPRSNTPAAHALTDPGIHGGTGAVIQFSRPPSHVSWFSSHLRSVSTR